MLTQHPNQRNGKVMSNPTHPIQPRFPVAAPASDNDEIGDPCAIVLANLPGYMDEDLDMNQRRYIENHLSDCPTCAAELDALRSTDSRLQREWCESAPLPSSSEYKHAIDSIMAALPPAPARAAAFAPKRVHAKARWIRFSTGFAGLMAFLGLLWSSYYLGYVNGRRSLMDSFSPRLLPVGPQGMPTDSRWMSPASSRPLSSRSALLSALSPPQ